MKLAAITAEALPGALELLLALGQGENGFGGTPVGDDPGRLAEWLDYCVHLANAEPLSDDFPRQANYWVVDETGWVVGMVRLQPAINAALLNWGGHLGYYIVPSRRGQGYGKAALRLALDELRSFGVGQALVTVETLNLPSLRVVAGLGGVQEDERTDPLSGRAYGRYWLETA